MNFIIQRKRLSSWWLRWERTCLLCRRLGFDPWLGRSFGERNGYPLQYSCLENFTHRGAWKATFHGISESDTTERLIQTSRQASTMSPVCSPVQELSGVFSGFCIGHKNVNLKRTARYFLGMWDHQRIAIWESAAMVSHTKVRACKRKKNTFIER